MKKKTPKRNIRLLSAKEWTKTYNGNNIVKGYSKKYGVDKLCAIKELRIIGIEISEEYEKQVRQSLEALRKSKQLKKVEKEAEVNSISGWESDENFAVIVGYTSGGFPYGLTHDEWDDLNNNTEIE